MKLIPLREVDIYWLDPLLEEEVAEWMTKLHWDYTPTLTIIKRFIAAKSLPGYALIRPDRTVAGYTYYITDQTIGFIGDLFITRRSANREEYSRLVNASTNALAAHGAIRRIECQIFPFNFDASDCFRVMGYDVIERLFMEIDLQDREGIRPERLLSGTWDPKYLPSAAKVVYDSYVGSPDSGLCRDYQSVRGCLRFLRNLVENAACGMFVPDETLVETDESGEVCGLILATRISADTGMIPQISVRRDCQGKGIGSNLLESYLKIARERGLKRVALSVSRQNRGALRLYEKIGFRVRQEFHACIWCREVSRVGL